jgi:hypothetical protein
MNEHEGYLCVECGSSWIRWEHIDGKDCTEECQEPCVMRCCNEENCAGEAIKDPSQKSISWGELAELTHATQVERFNWCSCEEQEDFPYADCPREAQV